MITPCKNICKIRNGVCIGCNRTLDEIKNWSKFTDEQRNNIMKNLDNIWEAAEYYFGDMPEEVKNKMPVDGAEEHDHYIYGTPKKNK